MTKKKCPLGENCDLTIAWMAGAARARDNISAGHLHLQLKVNRIGEGYIENDPGMELDCVRMDGAFNLRAVAEGLRQGPDRVTPLEKQVEALTEQLAAARRDAEEAEAYAEELEAKLAMALEALKHAKLNMPHPDQLIDDTIAELTGGKDE